MAIAQLSPLARLAVAAPIVALALIASVARAAPSAAARAAAPPDAERAPLTHVLPREPVLPRAGLDAAWEALGIDALARAWAELQSAPAPGELGGPEAGLGWREILAFYDGRLVFTHVFTVAEGLGPTYNDTACANCHRSPVIGGDGDASNFVIGHGPKWTDGDAVGVRKYAIAGFPAEAIEGPTSKMRTPPLFGLGLLDAVPQAVTAALEDPNDANGDGIRGRRGVRYGAGVALPSRFGHKANEVDLAGFSAGAMGDEIGVTNTVRREPRADRDGVADPELDRATVERVIAFVRYLGRVPPLARDAEAERGRALFDGIGCTGCHKAKLGDVEGAYTDLLLHDMGPGLAGLKDGSAGMRDWRTAPLWGLRLRTLLLHDGRAATPEAAALLHGGEAQRPRDAFKALPGRDRAAIAAFLRTL